MNRRFMQVDVFSGVPFKGNPLAVVFGADDLTTEQMQAIARWTNLSETAFVLTPDDAAADYRVRIFTTQEEFPFAGHPTLGTAYAVLRAGLHPKTPGQLIQQCGVGLVPVRLEEDGSLAFRAPPATFTPLDPALGPLLSLALGNAAIGTQHPPIVVDMGIRWLVVRLDHADDCLAWRPEAAALERLQHASGTDGLAVYGAHPGGMPADYEVRALAIEHGGMIEDPVTGSANACIARVLAGLGQVDGYRARQGTIVGRDGRIIVSYRDGTPWIGGQVVGIIDGEIVLPS